MKGKLIAFASILCIASLMVSGANAGKPDDPGNKGKGKTETELIFFTGDLEGWAHVEGCCPNAGPFPEYTLTLTNDLVDDSLPPITPITVYQAGTYNGELFMNGYGGRGDNRTIVQFHACCDDLPCDDPSLPTISFEIIGGESESVGDKKNKVHTVTFVNEPYWNDWNRGEPAGHVTFTITTAPSHMEDIFPCDQVLLNNHLCP